MVKYGYLAAFFVCLNMLLTPLAAAQDGKDFFAESRFIISTQQGSLPGFMHKKIDLASNDMLLKEILENLEQKVPVQFAYMESLVAGDKRFSFTMRQLPFHEVLSKVLDRAGIGYGAFEDGYIVLRKQEDTEAQKLQATLTGTITDGSSGEGLPGANVSIEGTTRGASTDAEGQYRITGVEPGTYTLVATFIGYQENRREVTVTEGQESVTVDFTLQPAAMSLDEMVVVGYGTLRRSDVTGSISSVSSEDLQNLQTENVAEALQGQAAGALITQSSGEPGAGMDVMIRGASTLGSTDPLYVVDGIPTSGDLSSINVSNIESIEILKDASATAIYGSRAANGVVMITTNRGTAGDLQVDISARTGISNVPDGRRLEMMNTQDFYDFSLDAYQNAGLPIPTAWQDPYLQQNLQVNTDWQDQLFRQGAVQNYNLTVSGGNESAVYSFSSGYLDEKGTLVSDGFERLSFRMNSEFYVGEHNRLTIGENISLSQTRATGAVTNDTFKEVYQQSPTVKLRCPENIGGFCGPTQTTSPGFRANQVALLYLNEDIDITQRLLGTAYAEYDILDNLSYRLNLSTDWSFGDDQSFSPLYNIESNVNTERDLNQNRSESKAYIVENTLTYNATFSDVHEIQVLAGFTQEKREFENITGIAQGFPSGNLRTINAATGETVISGGATASALRSLLGRVQYNYDDRYRAQFALRRDGSSRFGSERRWGTFPSGSVSWSMHNESFMSEYEDLSRLTLRGSWGITGTQAIPDFAAIPTVQPVANYVLGEGQSRQSGSAILDLGNSELQWQETKQLDFGLDVGFFDERITFVLDYFTKNTSNLLLRPPVATTSGIRRNNGAFQNVGEVKNSGFEFSANYQKSYGEFSFRVGGNISTIKNEVISLGVEEIVTTVSDELGYGQTLTRPGTEVGAFYGYIAEGPFQDEAAVDNHATQASAGPGDMAFRDLNGDGVIDPEDRTIIGSPFPDFFYGMNLNVNYHNWGLRVQMDGVQGRDIMALRSDNDPKGFNNATTDYLDRWTPENRDGAHPRAHTTDPNTNLRSSTYRVKDGSYLAIRNVTLSYDVNPDILSSLVQFRNLRLYVTSSNLAWATPYDGYNPEIGAGAGQQASLTRSLDSGSYPIARTFEMGIDIGF